jgi:hypothetical protein
MDLVRGECHESSKNGEREDPTAGSSRSFNGEGGIRTHE